MYVRAKFAFYSRYEDDSQKDAQDQGADVQALGGGGVALGPSDVADHLPVPRLEEERW